MPVAIAPTFRFQVLPRMPASWSAWLHAARLDDALVRGASPAATAELAARARQVSTRRRRCRIAKGLNLSVHRSAQPATWPARTARVGVVREAATEARPALERLARRLLSPAPPAPAGVVLARRLLTDGVGPLYVPSPVSGTLRATAERALDACGP